MIDFDKPVRSRQLHMDETHPAEILRANLPAPFVAVGLVYLPKLNGKGLDPIVCLFDATGNAENGYRIENYEPEPAPFAARSLRVNDQNQRFETHGGITAVFVDADDEGLHWHIQYPDKPLGYLTTDKTGRPVEPRPTETDEFDIVEVNDMVTRYVRIYDKSKTSKNPSRCDNWYEFASLAEAQQNMQGVRAVVEVTYREGDNFPCPA